MFQLPPLIRVERVNVEGVSHDIEVNAILVNWRKISAKQFFERFRWIVACSNPRITALLTHFKKRLLSEYIFVSQPLDIELSAFCVEFAFLTSKAGFNYLPETFVMFDSTCSFRR